MYKFGIATFLNLAIFVNFPVTDEEAILKSNIIYMWITIKLSDVLEFLRVSLANMIKT